MAFDRSLRQSLAAQYIVSSEHFIVGDYAALHCRLKTASAFGSIDCALHKLRLQTIFDGYVLAFRRHHSYVVVLARFTPLSTRNLRLLFRAANAGLLRFLLQSHGSHTSSLVPPTHRGAAAYVSRPRQLSYIVCDADYTPLRGREDLSPPANGKGMIVLPTRECGVCRLYEHSLRQSLASSYIAKPEHFWPRLCCAPHRLKTATAFGTIDCALRLHSAFRRHPSCVGGWLAPLRLWLQTIFDGCTSSAVNPETSACFSGSSMSGLRAPSCTRREPTISTFLPPIEEVALATESVGFLYISSATLRPPQAPMDGATLHLLHCGRRPTAYVSFERPAAHGTEGSAHCLSASPRQRACRSTSYATPLCAVHSKPPTLLWLSHLRYAPHRHHRPSPHSTSASRDSGAVVCVPVRERNFHAHGSDLTAHWLCIFRSERGGRSERKRQGGGGSLQTAVKGKPLNNPRNGCITAV